MFYLYNKKKDLFGFSIVQTQSLVKACTAGINSPHLRETEFYCFEECLNNVSHRQSEKFPHLNVYALATGAASPGYTLVPRAGSPGYTFVPRAGSPEYTPVIGLVALIT